jgi:membrane-associated phospholipid phosphatase
LKSCLFAWLAGTLLATAQCANAATAPEVILDDLGYLVSAPSRWENAEWRQAGWATLGILGTAAIIDRPLQTEMRRNAPNNNGVILQIERFGAQYAVGVIGGFYLAGWAGDATAATVAQDSLAASVVATGLITPTIKLLLGRSRPRANLGSSNFKPLSDPNASFPSGHTTEAFVLASVISEHYQQSWIHAGSYTLAGLVGAARSYHDAHFASDILTGALIGTLVGQTVVAHNQTFSNEKISLLPDFNANKVGVRLTGNF